MNIAEDIRPISLLKTRAAQLLAQVKRTRRPLVITKSGQPAGVLQDVKSYEQAQRTIGLLKMIAQSEEEIRAGKSIPHDAVMGQLRRRLKKRVRKNG